MKELEGHGKRHYANYPTALENASAVTATIRDRVKRGKTLKLGPYDRSMKDLLPDDCMIFPLGAVEKALEPGVFRALSDHTRTEFNSICDVERYRYSLNTIKEVEQFLKKYYHMNVADVQDAFPILFLRPMIWKCFLLHWYDVDVDLDKQTKPNTLYGHLACDFGAATVPGCFWIFMHVLIALAYHRSLLSLPLVIHVDDLAIIGPDAQLVDSEAAAFAAFLLERGVSIKELKVRFGAMVQLYIGFWWDSIHGTRRLEARKCEQYKLHLESAVAAKKYSLRELQSLCTG